MKTPLLPALGRRLAVPCALLLLAACSDRGADAVTASKAAPPRAGIIYPADQAIDPSDTYIIMDGSLSGTTTLQATTAFVDPRTDAATQQISIPSPTEHLHLEGGYGYQNELRVNTSDTDQQQDGLQQPVNLSGAIRSVDNGFSIYDRGGAVIPEVVPPGEYPVGPLSDDLGSLVDAQITDGVVIDSRTVDTVHSASRMPAPGSVLFSISGAGSRMERLSDDRIRFVSTFDVGSRGATATTAGAPRFSAQADPDGRGNAKMTRTFRKENGKYLLDEVVTEADVDTEHGHMHHVQTFKIRNLHFYQNEAKDHGRRVRREARAKGEPVSGPKKVMTYCIIDDYGNPCDGSGGGGGGGYTPPPPPPPCTYTAGGQRLALQHGFGSDSTTWNRMRPWLLCDYSIGKIAQPSTSWTQRIPSQATQLQQDVANAGGTGYIAIGHSNGGLVSRRFAQNVQYSSPGLVNGVVTLSSPNQGAVVAKNGQTIANLLDALLARFVGVAPIRAIADNALPVYLDDIPGSSFLTGLNSSQENFTRAGIQNYVPKRWVAWRIFKSKDCGAPESSCGGKTVAQHTQRTYDKKKKCAIVGLFTFRPDKAISCALTVLAMNAGDYGWDLLTTSWGGNGTDGFIQGWGQVYPSTPGGALQNFGVYDSDSHVEQVRSPKVYQALKERVLTGVFYVPLK